ncbi:unnamed protein product [Schistosoma curassoni]|uniref:Phosphopyruvate hydratase n=1 Tax=Schistosoma curassoni TaxID=6186 RepID=A0A183KKZ4_9TREM|nr:unnamed protein product [Schistosoma curassoni]
MLLLIFSNKVLNPPYVAFVRDTLNGMILEDGRSNPPEAEIALRNGETS